MKKTKEQLELEIMRAKHTNDLTILLRPYYSFRLFIKFKKAYYDSRGQKKDSTHFYGIENSCTYNQCYHGHVENILLNKLTGFENCLYLAERKYAGNYFFAKIYSRTSVGGNFDTLVREYNNKGEIVEQQDPVLNPSVVLHFTIPRGYLVITEDVIPGAEEFKSLVAQALE